MDSHDSPFNYDKSSNLLSAEARELQRMVRSFSENEIQSAQLEMDRNHEFPYECWESGAGWGWLAPCYQKNMVAQISTHFPIS